jgi:hypothetical protein
VLSAGPGYQFIALEITLINLDGTVSLILPIAARLERQGHGLLRSLHQSPASAYMPPTSSTASPRSAWTPSAKVSVTRRPFRHPRHGIRPGYAKAKMTAGRSAQALATTPEVVAAATVDGMRARAHTIRMPGDMRWIMRGLQLLSRPLFRRLPI